MDIAEALIQHGANVNVPADDESAFAGETLLMQVAMGDGSRAQFGIGPQEGAELDVRMARLLLANGAQVAAERQWTHECYYTEERYYCGQTAYDFAGEEGNQRLVRVLLAWTRWHRLGPKVRFAGRVAATLIRMMKEAAERAYTPGGLGFETASQSFQEQADSQLQ